LKRKQELNINKGGSKMVNARTTITGILAILGAIVAVGNALLNGTVDAAVIGTAITSITAGIGLIFAKDAEKK
jgi:hypothetical protein